MSNADYTLYPTMCCPQCHVEQVDYDGFGILFCDECGYCTHAAQTGGKCDLCGKEMKA